MPTPIALGVLAFLVVVLLVIMSKTGSRHREAAPAPARAAERLPNTQAQRSSNGLVTVHFPTSFIVKESTTRPDGSIVVLDAKEGYETISFYSWATPDATDVWKLDALWHASDVRSWERAGTRFVGEERRTDGKCHGEDAAIVVRHASTKDGTNVRVWTCAFLHDHHAFRFVTFTLEAVTPDDAYLNSILDAAEL